MGCIFHLYRLYNPCNHAIMQPCPHTKTLKNTKNFILKYFGVGACFTDNFILRIKILKPFIYKMESGVLMFPFPILSSYNLQWCRYSFLNYIQNSQPINCFTSSALSGSFAFSSEVSYLFFK